MKKLLTIICFISSVSLMSAKEPVVLQTVELMGNRFATFCIMIRTTPWEVSRDVKLHPRDEVNWHTLESVTAMREAFAKNNPDGRLTWGFTLNALEDPRQNFREIRDYAVACHKKYGDEVSYFPGYFPAMYLPRERINREMTEAIQIITKLVGNGYRPLSIIGGFLSADNLKYLSEVEKIHVAHAVIWSQHNIDGGGADGSLSYPFYPSTEHFCKPAQGKSDFIDCVNLDGWTMDFICARQSGTNGHAITGYNSRRGIGMIWRNHYKTNDDLNYRFEARGSGLGDSYNNLEIKWFMNKEFRLAILRDWHKRQSPAYVIDFTRYDLPAKEPDDPSPQRPVRDWSLMNVINQKGRRPQDVPKLINDLEKTDKDLIMKYYPELF